MATNNLNKRAKARCQRAWRRYRDADDRVKDLQLQLHDAKVANGAAARQWWAAAKAEEAAKAAATVKAEADALPWPAPANGNSVSKLQ